MYYSKGGSGSAVLTLSFVCSQMKTSEEEQREVALRGSLDVKRNHSAPLTTFSPFPASGMQTTDLGSAHQRTSNGLKFPTSEEVVR